MRKRRVAKAKRDAAAVQLSKNSQPTLPVPPSTPKARSVFVLPSTPSNQAGPSRAPTGLTPRVVNFHQRNQSHATRSPVPIIVGPGKGLRNHDKRKPLSHQHGPLWGTHSPSANASGDPRPPTADRPEVSSGPFQEDHPVDSERPERQRTYRGKRAKTVAAWTDDILPKLRDPIMRLKETTNNLRDPAPEQSTPRECSKSCGGRKRRKLSVFVLRQMSVGRISLQTCECCPAAPQLIEMGLFPCSPYRPTLAIDINILEFVRVLFLNLPPNVTAWCKASEAFLSMRGHKLESTDNLRKRFGYALLWYGQLQDLVDQHLDEVVSDARMASEQDLNPGLSTSVPTRKDDLPLAERPVLSSKRSAPSDESQPPHTNPPASISAPTDYLRSRCPACFATSTRLSQQPPDTVDCIVAIDACFSQKHNLQQRDPPFDHYRSIMIPDRLLSAAEVRMEHSLPTSGASKKHADGARAVVDSQGDNIIRLPAESLRTCEQSFKAAQEYVAKTDTGRHDVTAAMALLCRHDIPLFWVNMTTAGERRFYAIALLDALMEHLPVDWTVGFLYDIACQIHASAVKRNLFDYLARLRFAVSVFHAFGHDYPCQSIYHPRKCIGFGLSDGEGCERFWNALSSLVSYLRIAGFNLRLYTLNSQFHHMTQTSVLNMGLWISRKRKLVATKRAEAEVLIAEAGPVGQDRLYILAQWRAQVDEITKPGPRQTKKRGRTEVEQALELLALSQEADDEVERQRKAPRQERTIEEQKSDVEAAQAQARVARARYDRKVAHLGVPAQADLRSILNNSLVHDRVNALVLLRRIQSGIMKRKLELERVVRAHRSHSSEQHLRAHTKTAVERREGNIKTMVKRYNAACRALNQKISNTHKRGRPSSVLPLQELPAEGLWKLDIDDACWDDLRFSNDTSDGCPPWMVDPNVRQAIRAHLVLERCVEEEARLAHEVANLQQWFVSEWRALALARRSALASPGSCSALFWDSD
ncbi:hypothetical protein GGF50DRAFT_64520 [Schizophyllum commune]